jgi:translation initiation factor 2B subunit (eIF-2B alpha/beta/delta family)
VRTSKDFKFHVYSGKISKCEDFQDIVVIVDKGRLVRVWNSNNRYERDGVRVPYYDLTPGTAVDLVVPRVGACIDVIVLTEPGGCP